MKEYAIYVQTTSSLTTDSAQLALLVQNSVKPKEDAYAGQASFCTHLDIASRFVLSHMNFIMGHPNLVDAKMG